MINDMTERVARTLRTLTKQNGGKYRGDDDTGWRDYVEDARAVIEAMRSPTADMENAALEQEEELRHPSGRIQPRLVWSLMIDTALKEGR